MTDSAQDRRMAFAKRDFYIVLKERGGWYDFHRIMKIPKPTQAAVCQAPVTPALCICGGRNVTS
jgi:hypothetical protein